MPGPNPIIGINPNTVSIDVEQYVPTLISGDGVSIQGQASAAPAAYPGLEHPWAKGKVKRKFLSPDGTTLVSDIFGIPDPYIVDWDRYSKYFKDLVPDKPYVFIAPKTLVGIEIEVENVLRIGPNVPLALWQIKEDGSLRNSGREFVTPGVIPMSTAEAALRLLAKELNPDVDFSKRTGDHVHLDVRQLQFKQLIGLLFTYVAVENLMFKFVGVNRRNNIFCVPLIETGLLDGLSNDMNRFLFSIEHNWHKYSALNLLPITKFGSIEFRHMPGTLNVPHLLQWLDLIGCLKVYAYRHSLEDILETITRLNSNSRYQQFVESVFGDRCLYLDMSNLLADMEKAVYLIKHCGASNSFNSFVYKNMSNESQLGKRLNIWMKHLSADQKTALRFIANAAGRPNELEDVFKAVLENPNAWRTGVLIPYVDTLIKPVAKTGRKIKKEIVKSEDDFTSFVEELSTLTEDPSTL